MLLLAALSPYPNPVRARFFLTIGLLLLSQFPGAAQNAAAAPDFSDGFNKLAALGLPALDSAAKWVTSRNSSLPYELTRAAKSLKGNAWLVPAATGKAQLLPLGAVTPYDGKPSATSPDLAKDVGTIIAAINKSAQTTDENASDSLLNNRYSSSTIDADLLLFATQLHQTGHADLANQLAFALFSAVPSRETVVDAAIDKFASALYGQAAVAFFKSADWAAYEKSLTDLSKRFPRGWSQREAVAMFLPQVAKQAAGLKPPAPTLPDTPIDPRALAILSELADPPKPAAAKPTAASAQEALLRQRMMEMGEYEYGGRGSGLHPLWLLDPPAEPKPDAPPLERLAALKMAALPALAALLGDPYLTHSPNGGSYSFRSNYSSNESPEEILFRKYQSLHRPSTRGEIAKQLLLATLPDSDDSSNETDDESLRQQTLEFWKAHQNATRDELAAVFLREGSRSQITQAARLLATATDPQSHQIFEGHVLGLDPVLGAYQEVQTYLRARKTAGKPFFDAFAKLARSQTPADAHLDDSGSGEGFWLIKQSGGVEKMLKSLGTLVDPLPPRSLAVQIAKGKPEEAEEAIDGLRPLMADLSPTKQLHAYLEGANAATDAEVRAHFLRATIEIDFDEENDDEDAAPVADEDEAPPRTDRQVSEPELKVWRKLMADTRRIPARFDPEVLFRQASSTIKPTVAELAALTLEMSINPAIFDKATAAKPITGKSLTAIIHEHATARLAGQTLPPFPDASKVAKERLAAIVAEATTKPATEIDAYLFSLTQDERAAWLRWIRSPKDLPMPPAIKDLRAVITSRTKSNRGPFKDTVGVGNFQVGFKLTPESLAQHIESLAPEIAKHSREYIGIRTSDFTPGLEINGSIVPLPAPKAEPSAAKDSRQEEDQNFERIFESSACKALDADPDASAVAIVGWYSNETADKEAVWLIQNGKASLQEPEQINAAFKELLDQLPKQDPEGDEDADSERLGRGGLARGAIWLHLEILTRDDAEKIKAAIQEQQDQDAADEDSNLLPPP
jgi:hypothetical protein